MILIEFKCSQISNDTDATNTKSPKAKQYLL